VVFDADLTGEFFNTSFTPWWDIQAGGCFLSACYIGHPGMSRTADPAIILSLPACYASLRRTMSGKPKILNGSPERVTVCEGKFRVG
jgi:hypothetical protein